MLTPEQRSHRRTGLGGSDIAAVLGESPWGCALSVWNDKRGVGDAIEKTPSKHLERGAKLEDFIATEWAELHQRTIRRTPKKRHPQYEWAISLPDRDILKDPRGVGILEVKCPSKFVWLDYRRNGIPAQYILQGQWYLFVTGRDWGAYAIFNAELMEFADEGKQPFEFGRNDKLIAAALPKLEIFWRQVEFGPAPEKLPAPAKPCQRCKYRQMCHEEEPLPAPTDDAVMSDDPALIGAIQRYAEFADIEKAAAEEKKAALEEAAALAGNAKTRTPAGLVSIVPGPKRLDTEAIKAKDPALAKRLQEEFTKQGKPYPRIYPAKERA